MMETSCRREIDIGGIIQIFGQSLTEDSSLNEVHIVCPYYRFKVANNGAKFPREIMPDGKSYSKGKRLEYDILLRPGFINAHIVFGGNGILIGKEMWGVNMLFNHPGRSEFYQVFPAHGVDAEKFRQQIISLVASFSNANFTNNDSIEEFVKTAKANICNGEVYGIFSPDVNEPFLVSHQRILKFVKTLTTEDIPPPPADPEIYNRVWHIKTSSPISGVSLFVIMHRDDVSTTISVFYLVVRL